MGPGREQDDHDTLFQRAPWRLRFADPDRELDFRQWHADRAAPFDVKGKGPTPTWLLDGRRAGAPGAAEPAGGDAPVAPV